VKILCAFFAGWFLFKLYGVIRGYYDYKFYKAQGVEFICQDKFTVFADLMRLTDIIERYPNTFSWMRMFKHAFEEHQKPLPQIVACNMFGSPYLFF
jgi:hypothetical protein